ncbi:hypothetical protein AB0M44_29495 [Streptosporangium subroseum]|uniref:hypothetical protein n=1 Tax=Streptosporangium subroseum TaxID=106412 RepID=UPI00341C3485
MILDLFRVVDQGAVVAGAGRAVGAGCDIRSGAASTWNVILARPTPPWRPGQPSMM